ncbi:MAG TPA: hypothetical protein VFI23_16320 [Rhizomicrobium sp.]|nr:hypothetical protein [Rhizomicrobium sp.]
MKSTLTMAVFAGGTILALQALAQLPPQVPGGATSSNAMSTAGSMLKGGAAGCQGLIDKASSLAGAFQGGMKSSILSEITQAQSSLSAGNETSCMSHANKAMTMLK